jgi:hypothetical protein
VPVLTSAPLSTYIVPLNLQRALIDFDQLMNARCTTKATSLRRHPYPLIARQQVGRIATHMVIRESPISKRYCSVLTPAIDMPCNSCRFSGRHDGFSVSRWDVVLQRSA